MIGWLKQLVRRGLGRTHVSSSSLPAAPVAAPQWTPGYAQDLKHFLGTECGVVLMSRARAMECATALRACQNPDDCHPQRAAGVSDAINWLQSLTQFSESPADPGELYEPRHGESGVPDPELAYTH